MTRNERTLLLSERFVYTLGHLEGSGITARQEGCGTFNLAVTNNQIRQYNNFGIQLQAGFGIAYAGTVNFTVTGNTVASQGTNLQGVFQGIALNNGVTPGDSYQTCADILNNIASNSGRNGGNDIRVRARQSTTVRLPGYVGSTTDIAAVASYLLGRNTAVTASAQAPDATSSGYVGGAACATP